MPSVFQRLPGHCAHVTIWLVGLDQRTKRLNEVVNNSRFLILPWVHVKNLASKVLALSVKKLPQDWQTIYSYKPVLLETFVEKERFLGTCYKAANWQQIGETQGRGKWDRNYEYVVPIKAIYIYPLNKNFREILNRSDWFRPLYFDKFVDGGFTEHLLFFCIHSLERILHVLFVQELWYYFISKSKNKQGITNDTKQRWGGVIQKNVNYMKNSL